jgi:hypothetical protein
MDSGIWATWYNLDPEHEDVFLKWMHGTYLPKLKAVPGYAWAAHYFNTRGGPAMIEYDKIVTRAEEEIGSGGQYVVIVGAASPHTFFKPFFREVIETEEHREMLALRRGVRTAVFVEEARVNGPSAANFLPGSTPAPAIQFGSYRIKSTEEEFGLAQWYAKYRFPHMSQMPGCVATRKLLCVAGWVKHGILYEFESLEARMKYFEEPHEALALDPNEWTGRIFRSTIHTPGSPVVGQRIWPPCE